MIANYISASVHEAFTVKVKSTAMSKIPKLFNYFSNLKRVKCFVKK